MKLSCSTFLFQNLPLGGALQKVRGLGFVRAELGIDANPRWGHFMPQTIHNEMEEAASMVETAVQESGVGISDINAHFDFTNSSVRGEFESVCAFARRLGAGVINVSATHPSEAIALNCLSDYVSVARDYSITLSMETLTNSLCRNLESALRILEQVRGLKFTIDTGYLISNGHSQECWEQLYPYIGLVHIRDAGNGRNNYQVPVGSGDLDIGMFLDDLLKIGYQGIMVVEYLGPDRQSRDPMDFEEETLKMRERLDSELADREAA